MIIIKMLKTDTHYYDGNLIPRKAEVQHFIDLSKSVTKDEQFRSLNTLRDELEKMGEVFTPNARNNLNTIIQDHSTNPHNNYDHSNDYNVVDLLYGCYIVYEKNKDILPLLAIQLDEMSSGMCPAGRTHRIFQILVCYTTIS